MSDGKMDPMDRELMIAASLAAGCCGPTTTGMQVVAKFREVLTAMAQQGGVAGLRKSARSSIDGGRTDDPVTR